MKIELKNMKHETSNLLIGLGIGAVVGVAVGYLMVADNRKKLAEEFDHAVSKVKEEVKDVYSKAKNTPFLDTKCFGLVKYHILDGKIEKL